VRFLADVETYRASPRRGGLLGGGYDALVVNFLLQNVGPLAIQYVAQAVRERPVGGGDSGEGQGPDGCPACDPERNLGDAERKLAGIVLQADPATGRVPGHVAATVLLAEQSMRLSLARLDEIAAERPDLAGRTDDLRSRVETARSALPERGEVDLASARTAHAEVEECWREAHDLAVAYWAPRPPSSLDRVAEVVRGLPEADRERFIASLRT
jgi:hypothetical protein